jgi:hypothetical protein
MTVSVRLVRGASLVLAAGVAALATAVTAAAPASAEGPGGGGGGGGAGSPSNGRYVAWVQISGNGAGSGGDLAGPPVSSSGGGGRVSVPSPCGYSRGETQQSIEAAYIEMAKGDVEYAKQLLLGMANKMDSLSQYTMPSSTLKAKLQYENWGKTGVWYDSLCDASVSDADFREYVYNVAPPVLTDGGPPPPPPLIADPQLLHDIAVRAMTLPDPAVQVVNPRTVVRLDTYVWVRPDDTGQRTVTAAVPGLSVTVTATAQSVSFTTTGAPSIDCGVVKAATPSCALTWTRSSGRAPGQQFGIVGHVDWTATATDGIPVPGAQMDSAPLGITVLEVQTVNGGD